MKPVISKLSRGRLDALATKASVDAPHLAGILQLVRDCGVQLLIVPQQAYAIRDVVAEARRPFVAIIADDTDRAVGPDFFEKASLDRFLGLADAAAVISSAARADVYNAVGSLAALLARNVIIVETRPEQEIAWTKALQRVSPCLPTVVCTVEATRQ